MLKHSTSLATLFGRSACPLFLATALVVAPGVAHAADIIVDQTDTLNETNGDATGGTNTPGAGDTLTLEDGVTLDIDEDGIGLYAGNADGVTIINNGTINTYGTSNDNGTSASATISADQAGRAHGILVETTDNALVINNGLINVDDYYGAGIRVSDAYNALVINRGVINVSGLYGYGLYLRGGDNPVAVNDGSIYVSGEGFLGMQLLMLEWKRGYGQAIAANSGGLMINNGLISVDAYNSYGNWGMTLWGLDVDKGSTPNTTYLYEIYSSAYNYGTIEILNDTAVGSNHFRGMEVRGHEADLYNYGSIYVKPNGAGMVGVGSSLGLYNYGTIVVDGENATGNFGGRGMSAYLTRTLESDPGSNTDPGYTEDDYNLYRDGGYHRNTLVNAGTIIVNGTNAVGIFLGDITEVHDPAGDPNGGASGHDVYNYGRIEAPNGWVMNLHTGENNNPATYDTVNLLDGSILVGDILLESISAQHIYFVLGDGLNAAISFDTTSGVYTSGQVVPLHLSSANGYVIVDDTIYTVDLDGYAQQDQASWSLFSMVQDAVDQGTASRRPSGNFAFHGHDKDDGFEMWATMFADWVYDPGDDDVSHLDPTADHTAGYLGYSAGTIVGVNKDALSFYLGAAYSDVSSEEEVDYTTHSGTLFGGVAGTIAERLNVSLTAGAAYNQTNRDMADSTVSGGIDKASANYASFFLSPSLLINGPISGSSLRVNYLGAWHQAHDFSFDGGTQIDVDSRFSNVFGAQLQMAHKLPLTNETFPTRIRYGVEASYADGQAIGYNLMGTDFETDYDNGFSARGFAALEVGPTFIKAGYGTDEQVSINAGLTLRF